MPRPRFGKEGSRLQNLMKTVILTDFVVRLKG